MGSVHIGNVERGIVATNYLTHTSTFAKRYGRLPGLTHSFLYYEALTQVCLKFTRA